MKWLNLWLSVFLIAGSGCANWNSGGEVQSRSLELTKSRMSPRSVGIEVAVAQLDASQKTQLQQLMQRVDQQKLSLDVRKQLDRNGLTCGVMSTRAPAVFHELLAPYTPDPDSVDVAARPLALAGKLDPVSRLLIHQRISNQDGEVYPVGTSDVYRNLDWVVYGIDHVERGSAETARCFFDISSFPKSDGSATLKLSPVIRHGKEIPRIDVASGSFVMDRGQRRTTVDELEFDISLRAGQTLVLGASKPFGHDDSSKETLGSRLLGSDNADATRLLLVRLVQTQMDDLFDRSLR